MASRGTGISTIDMVHGPLLGKIMLFSLPLMASTVLQLLFNAADVVVVGQFAGYGSLAAVGSTTNIIYLVTNLLIGISVGVNVVIARNAGQTGRDREISLALHTAVLLAIVGGVALGGVGMLAAGPIMTLVSTPEDIYGLTVLYLRIYFVGTPFVMLYNYGAAALRAVGDTRRPLLYLLVSGVANVVLNLFFVIALRMDVAGVALATVLSQLLSAALVMRCLSAAQGSLHFSWKKLTMDLPSLKSMAHVGIPAGLQSCLFSLSNAVQQWAINTYNSSVIVAGSSASSSVENFVYSSMNAFHHASQTFISQNIGAGRRERVSPVFRLCMICTIVLGIVLSAIVLIFAPQFISLYNPEPEVVQAGVLRLQVVVPYYIIFGAADVLVGSIRGCGVPVVPVVINLLGTCALRLVWCGLLDTSRYGVEYVYLSYPVSWTVVLVALSAFWLWLRYKDKKLAESPAPREEI